MDATGQHASEMHQESKVLFSIVAPRGFAADVVKRALDSKLEDIVPYRTSVSFTEELKASQIRTLLQLQSAGVKVEVGQLWLSINLMDF